MPISWIDDLSPAVVTLRVPRSELSGQPEFRSDEEILADVRAALEEDDPIRTVGLHRVDVVVSHGTVALRGHVR